MHKQDIRKQIQEKRDKLSQEFIFESSKIIKEKLINMKECKEANTIYIYMSFNKEVETKDVILYAFENKKKVAIPKIVHDNIEFYYIEDINDTAAGKWRNTRTHRG